MARNRFANTDTTQPGKATPDVLIYQRGDRGYRPRASAFCEAGRRWQAGCSAPETPGCRPRVASRRSRSKAVSYGHGA